MHLIIIIIKLYSIISEAYGQAHGTLQGMTHILDLPLTWAHTTQHAHITIQSHME